MLELILFASNAAAHGTMVYPPIWLTRTDGWPAEYSGCHEGGCMWFTNYTFLPTTAGGNDYSFKDHRTMAADSPMRTYGFSDPSFAQLGRNPWAAPGMANIYSPCGVYGGNPTGCPSGDEGSRGKPCPGGGYGYGDDARSVYRERFSNSPRTKVAAGGVLEAAFNLQANHGGGYAYRLCKTPDDGDMTKLSEECFQAGHLSYATEESYGQFGSDIDARLAFKAQRSTNGTTPEKSVWTQNPIPPCSAPDGGVFTDQDDNCAASLKLYGQTTQFTPYVPGVQGYGEHNHNDLAADPVVNFASTFPFVIVDKLAIPAELEAGKYVLSWRWDCEQTSQIWSMCSDIEITNSDSLVDHLRARI